jgi:hypothetical protein
VRVSVRLFFFGGGGDMVGINKLTWGEKLLVL